MIIRIVHRSLSPTTVSFTFSAASTTFSLTDSSVSVTVSFNDLNESKIFERWCNSSFFSLVI
jgi:hypothetical protein